MGCFHLTFRTHVECERSWETGMSREKSCENGHDHILEATGGDAALSHGGAATTHHETRKRKKTSTRARTCSGVLVSTRTKLFQGISFLNLIEWGFWILFSLLIQAPSQTVLSSDLEEAFGVASLYPPPDNNNNTHQTTQEQNTSDLGGNRGHVPF